jgi:hypothetical protein
MTASDFTDAVYREFELYLFTKAIPMHMRGQPTSWRFAAVVGAMSGSTYETFDYELPDHEALRGDVRHDIMERLVRQAGPKVILIDGLTDEGRQAICREVWPLANVVNLGSQSS